MDENQNVRQQPSLSAERRNQALIGQLPDDFLCLPDSSKSDALKDIDYQTAMAYHLQQSNLAFYPPNVVGRLSISVVEAQLVKNYGITRMDPYVRLRLGHYAYETHTDTNGAKNPHWNKTVQCYLPHGIQTLNVEIIDECVLTTDSLIAYASIPLTKSLLQGETVENWYSLSGSQGENKEGKILLVMSFTPLPLRQALMQPVVQPIFAVCQPMYALNSPCYVPVSVACNPDQNVALQPTKEQMKQVSWKCILSNLKLIKLQEMFPSLNPEILHAVFMTNRGNMDVVVSALLEMSK